MACEAPLFGDAPAGTLQRVTTRQTTLDLRPSERVGDVLDRIRRDATSEAEKGRWFEHLFMATVRDNAEFDVAAIWSWRDWPERERLTGLDGRDHGIDLVAHQTDGTVVAIQCKCYASDAVVRKPHIDSFLNESARPAFGLRWVVSTCSWNAAAERAVANRAPRVARIDFLDLLNHEIRELQRPAEQRQPKPLQQQAIDAVYDGLATQGNDRGKLVMACGTGKTFTALRLSERVVHDEGRVLFAAPTIALVSQARREWLNHATRKMSALVVCSDSTAGGRGERQEMGADALVCDVIWQPAQIARRLREEAGGVKAVFCTYHSLGKVCEAQAHHNAPRFDLAIADEAHRTTGIVREGGVGREKVDFQAFHDEARLRAAKRLYMTATQRIYSEQSKQATKRAAEKRGLAFDVVDMSNVDVYGPLMHHVKFSEAVAAGELADYRVIVLGIREGQLTPGIRAALKGKNVPRRASDTDLCRLLGTMLALNGAVEGRHGPGSLSRSIAFASTIQRSEWFTDTINHNIALKSRVTRALQGRAVRADLESRHLDGNSTALQRNQERRWLNNAPSRNRARMICNVKVFSEGVDVPALDAVAFLDPKQSQIDIVQAVGRVMRKAPGKRLGYIVVPVFVPDGEDGVATLLEQRGDDYRHIGSVLRALQSHDERLAESPAAFVDVLIDHGVGGRDALSGLPPRRKKPAEVREMAEDPIDIEDIFTFHAVEPGIFAKVVAASGLGLPGQVTADDIVRSVGLAAKRVEDDAALLESLRQALDLAGVKDREVSTTAALLLCNACLLHRRLQKESPAFEGLPDLTEIGRSQTPAEALAEAWDEILGKDYAPVFRPALSIIENAPSFDSLKAPARMLAECAVNVSDTVAELGYDHAGPLYHKILGSAESDGAFYTNNISALMLAGLALSPHLVDWADWDQATGLRILDPACGTGTLLMAALKTIKDRMAAAQPTTPERARQAHKKLVENSIRGLDINYQATQLAASNLTLGAPTVDYEAMHIHTMRHGPQPDGTVALGSLELLPEAVGGRQPDLVGHVKQAAVSTPATTVARVPDIRDVDVVLMNPPFTNNEKHGRKFSAEVKKLIQRRKLDIKSQIDLANHPSAALIDSNSVRTFFTPLADALLREGSGVLGKILPTTACTSTSGIDERRFLAERFHIDLVVTSHDPKCPNFSVSTTIHESLLVCRRRGADEPRRPTRFIALNRMPRTAADVADWVAAVHAGQEHKLHRVFEWPAARVAEGDWTPCQYYDGVLAVLASDIDALDVMTPLGSVALVEPGGRRLRDAFLNPLDGGSTAEYPVVWTHETNERRTMKSFSDFSTEPKPTKREYATEVLWPKASRLLIACKIRASRIRAAAIHLYSPALGQPFIPVVPLRSVERPTETLKAWCAYLNSTPASLSFLNRRQKALDYSDYSLDQLRSIPVPDPTKCDLAPLLDAFCELGDTELLPWPRMDECSARVGLDAAAAQVLGIDPAELADWRERLVREPTISNKSASSDRADPGSGFIKRLMSSPSLDGVQIERDRSPMRDVTF